MNFAIILIFVVGYLAITFEHHLKINKTASALLTGVLCWTVYIVMQTPTNNEIVGSISGKLSHHLANIAEILFFLLGAMTIVELVDAHQGFKIITDKITSKNYVILLWIIALLSFFLSAILDNLTTAIVMVSMLKKLIKNTEQRMLFAGIVIISANAGGAWSPLGDVTTTMLWIGGQISANTIMKQLFLPSLVCMLVPLVYLSFKLRNQYILSTDDLKNENFEVETTEKERNSMFFVGIGSLLFVPIFKTITHLPPYMGVLLGLGLVWLVGELLHSQKDEEERKPLTAAHALSKIDTSSILFFLGILLAISALASAGILENLAFQLAQLIHNQDIIVLLIGLFSAIVDNVPLVAATMGMYDLQQYPIDHRLWELLAYCAGTGGSILIIGSAAGVAVMGMEKISFGWYVKNISWLAFLGYLAGAFVYLS